jgi:hypothetical protein
MSFHVDWHGTEVTEELANFVLSLGHAVLLDHPDDKEREILRNIYCVISQKTDIQNGATDKCKPRSGNQTQ